MLKVDRPLSRRTAERQPAYSHLEEQRKAEAQGVTVEVYRIQERLRRLPLMPREDWLRKKRAYLVEKLFVAARRDRCLKYINPWAAKDQGMPPLRF